MIDSSLRNQSAGRAVVSRCLLVGAIAATALVSGCATTQVKSPGDPMAALEQRVAERWQLVIGRDLVKAYEYLTPGYRSTVSVSDYVAREARTPLQFQKADQAGVECASPDSCLVEVDVSYSARLPGAGNVQSVNRRQERWLLTNDVWHLLPQ